MSGTRPQTAARAAIITGAGSGIGAALARLLAAGGWSLALAGRDETKLRTSAAACTTAGGARLLIVPTDMADPASVERLVHQTEQEFGRIDALVNNAGEAALLPIEKTGPRELARSFAVNAIGPACAIHFAWPVFARQKSGCVVNVSSLASRDPFPGFFAYAAAKSAVNSLTRSAAKEGETIGVRAYTIAPGAVETTMLRSVVPASQLPTERCLTPDEVARFAADCLEGRPAAGSGAAIFLWRGEDGTVTLEVG